MVCIDDLIHVYVDFNPIISTNSPDDALALLIAMYTIFELSFDKKSRTIRFLYCVLHGDKQFLSNSIRMLIKEKNIDIHRERPQLPSTSSSRFSNTPATRTVESQGESQTENTSSDYSTAKYTFPVADQTTESTTSTNISYSGLDMDRERNE